MKISKVLDHIDHDHIDLPEFQRAYVWNLDQVRGLFDSLYRRHPVRGLLVWATEANTADRLGEEPLAAGIVKLLLDCQQRITSLYGVVRGHPTKFFDGNAQAFSELRFHIGTATFVFYRPVRMQDDPLWIDLTSLMKAGHAGPGALIAQLSADSTHAVNVGPYFGRLSVLLAVTEINLHIEEVIGQDETLNGVLDISYLDFPEARKALLTAEANRRFEELLRGDARWMGKAAPMLEMDTLTIGGITSEVDEGELESLNDWVESKSLPRGQTGFDYADPTTGALKALFDIGWPDGLQAALSDPFAALLDENTDTLALAIGASFRCLTSSTDFPCLR